MFLFPPTNHHHYPKKVKAMPPSEEQINDDPSDQQRLMKTLLTDDTGTKQGNDDDNYDDEEEEKDDTSILLHVSYSSHGSETSSAHGNYYVSNLVSNDSNHISMLSEGFASHDESMAFFDQAPLDSSSDNDNDEEEEEEGVKESDDDDIHNSHHDDTNINHRIVLYYNSNTISSTRSLSMVDVRNRLLKNLQFIKDVKTQLGPFLEAHSNHFTMEYCDVANDGMFTFDIHIYSCAYFS